MSIKQCHSHFTEITNLSFCYLLGLVFAAAASFSNAFAVHRMFVRVANHHCPVAITGRLDLTVDPLDEQSLAVVGDGRDDSVMFVDAAASVSSTDC